MQSSSLMLQEVYDPMVDVCANDQFRLNDLRNFRPIEQADLKILDELNGLGIDQSVLAEMDMRDLLNNNNNSNNGNRSHVHELAAAVDPYYELVWNETEVDVKPDVSQSVAGYRTYDAATDVSRTNFVSCHAVANAGDSKHAPMTIDWLRNEGYAVDLLAKTDQAAAAEPTLMELSLHGNDSKFILPTCPEVDEDLLTGLSDCPSVGSVPMTMPLDGRFCIPTVNRVQNTFSSFSVPNTGFLSNAMSGNAFPTACKAEPLRNGGFSASMVNDGVTLRSLLENHGQEQEASESNSDSQSEMSVEPRGRTWSFNTNASSRSTATSGVFELSRSWTSQSSSDANPAVAVAAAVRNSGRVRRPVAVARSRKLSNASTSSSLSATSCDSASASASAPRRSAYATRMGGQQMAVASKRTSSSKSACFWYQRDVKARSNLLPVPKVNDRSFETDYDQPNPRKLIQLGNEIVKMSEVLQAVPQPSSVNDDDDKLNTKREKNKFASRICRLKKKARYEANKIKLFGLKREMEQVREVLAETKQLLSETNRNDKRQLAAAAGRIAEIARSRLGLMVAGSQTEYVNLVIDLAQRRTREADEAAGTSIRERLLSATAAENPEMRALAMKHTVPTYAEYFGV